MPNRILRDNALDSDRIAAVDEASEVLFYRLLMLADDFGRFDGRVSVIRARAFALRQQVTEAQVIHRLKELCKVGLIQTYEVAEKPYLFIPRFGQRQRAEKSKFPSPDSGVLTNDGQLSDTGKTSAHVVVVEDVVEGVGGRSAVAQESRPPKEKIEFFEGAFKGITEDQQRRWQVAYPAIRISDVIPQAASWLQANPSNRKSNYGRFLVNWFKREQDQAPTKTESSKPVKCAYCEKPALGKVNGYSHCREHANSAMDCIDPTLKAA